MWADDFWFRVEVSKVGFWRNIFDLYIGWDGRALSIPYWFRNFCVITFSSEITSMLASLAFLVTAYFYALSIVKVLDCANVKFDLDKFVLLIVAVAGLWLAMRPHLSRSLYWPTGSFYTFSNFMSAYWMISVIDSDSGSIRRNLLSLLTLSCGANLAGGLLTFYILAYWMGLLKLSKHEFITTFVFMVIGTCVCTLAPGNFGRAGSRFDFAFGSMLSGYLIVFNEYLFMSKGVLIGALALSSVIIFVFPTFEIKRKKLSSWAFVNIAAALTSIIPFIVMPAAASKHTSLFFQSFFFLGLTYFFLYFYQFANSKAAKNIALITVGIFLMYFIYTGFDQYVKGRIVKKQMIERYNLLESRRGDHSDIQVKSIKMPDDFFTNRIWEISSDSSSWENIALKEYFDVGNVSLR